MPTASPLHPVVVPAACGQPWTPGRVLYLFIQQASPAGWKHLGAPAVDRDRCSALYKQNGPQY